VGGRGAALIGTASLLLTALGVLTLAYEVGLSGSPVVLPLGDWIPLAYLGGEVGLSLDSLSVTMLVPVTGISLLVHLYSSGYMDGDPHVPRFFGLLGAFTLAMILLVTADSSLLLFAGWEGVGLCSYLLVSFWYTRTAASLSALRAFLMNRVGDLALLLALIAGILTLGDLSVPGTLACSPYVRGDLVPLLLVVGAAAKSAQLGLHTWLPAAMEGPTPVSALIHAATMVTAGIYLLLRFAPLLEGSGLALPLLLGLGSLTALYGALSGTVATDLKRVIAYSTVSQLGYMAVALAMGAGGLALLHLVNHAFFKALLFLSAGALLHATGDEQDLRRMGGLAPLVPAVSSALTVGGLSLLALPFLTGFTSKDPILEVGAMASDPLHRFGYLSLLGAAMLTATYTARLTLTGLLLPPRVPRSRIAGIPAGDASGVLLLPLLVLGVLSVTGGSLIREGLSGGGSDLLSSGGGGLYSGHPDSLRTVDGEMLPSAMRFLPLLPLTVLLLLTPYPALRPAPQSREGGSLSSGVRNAGSPLLHSSGGRSTGYPMGRGGSSRPGSGTGSSPGALGPLGPLGMASIPLLLSVTDWSVLGWEEGDILQLGSMLYLTSPILLLTVALLLTVTLVGVLLLLV
jgi:NADH-ubiquinone oxidoreductase chain 5